MWTMCFIFKPSFSDLDKCVPEPSQLVNHGWVSKLGPQLAYPNNNNIFYYYIIIDIFVRFIYSIAISKYNLIKIFNVINRSSNNISTKNFILINVKLENIFINKVFLVNILSLE